MGTTPLSTTHQARIYRQTMSSGEALLWSRIRSKQIGFKVRRQHAVGPYFLDFYIPAAKLCIEVDGKDHQLRGVSDARRDEYLGGQGITTLRIDGRDLYKDLRTQVDAIYVYAKHLSGLDPLA